jgi:hypothetical protein
MLQRVSESGLARFKLCIPLLDGTRHDCIMLPDMAVLVKEGYLLGGGTSLWTPVLVDPPIFGWLTSVLYLAEKGGTGECLPREDQIDGRCTLVAISLGLAAQLVVAKINVTGLF